MDARDRRTLLAMWTAALLIVFVVNGCGAIRRAQGKDPRYDCADYRYGDLLYEELGHAPDAFWSEKLVEPGYCEPDPKLPGWAAALALDVEAYTGQVPDQDRIIVTDSELGGARYVVLGKIRWPVFDGVDGYSCTEVALAGRALQVYDESDAVIVSRATSAPADTTANAFKRMFSGLSVASTVRVAPGFYFSSYSSGPPDYWMTSACGGIAVQSLDEVEPTDEADEGAGQ